MARQNVSHKDLKIHKYMYGDKFRPSADLKLKEVIVQADIIGDVFFKSF